jgi:hypothetical protein
VGARRDVKVPRLAAVELPTAAHRPRRRPHGEAWYICPLLKIVLKNK